jgi:hypothetical protein
LCFLLRDGGRLMLDIVYIGFQRLVRIAVDSRRMSPYHDTPYQQLLNPRPQPIMLTGPNDRHPERNLLRAIATDIHFWIPLIVLAGGLLLLDKLR